VTPEALATAIEELKGWVRDRIWYELGTVNSTPAAEDAEMENFNQAFTRWQAWKARHAAASQATPTQERG
jgi:hypothetical protein